MHHSNRRQFLKHSGTLVASTATFGLSGPLRGVGANERVILGVIGPGGMGTNLLKSFAAQKDVVISSVCDPDATRMSAAAKSVESIAGNRPKEVKDLRYLLDDKAVDAVIIATPDHWHAPAPFLPARPEKRLC
jgi:hypothetical protein